VARETVLRSVFREVTIPRGAAETEEMLAKQGKKIIKTANNLANLSLVFFMLVGLDFIGSSYSDLGV
jgi:hypothetical protein